MTQETTHTSVLEGDGHAFAIMGRMMYALNKKGHPKEVFASYVDEATAGDYEHLIRTTIKYEEQYLLTEVPA